jgi:hypothetical protein
MGIAYMHCAAHVEHYVYVYTAMTVCMYIVVMDCAIMAVCIINVGPQNYNVDHA